MDKITIRFIENIFEKEIVEVFEVPYQYQDLETWFAQVIKRDRSGFYPILSGRRAGWNEIPAQGDEVIFIQDVKDPITGAIMFIITAIQTFVATYPVLAMILGTLVSSLLGMAMSFLFAPEIPKDSFANSQTYQWDGIKNIVGEGSTVPVVYGRHRVGGAVIEAWVQGNRKAGKSTTSHLNVLLALSEGSIEEVELDTIKLNSQPIAQYKDVSTAFRLGTRNQNPIPGFSKIVRHFNITGVELRHNVDWIYSLNGDTLDSCNVNIASPAMFNSANDEGRTDSVGVSFDVFYAQYGTGNWVRVPGPGAGGQWDMSGKSKSTVNYTIPISFPSSGKYKIKITRKTQNFGSMKISANTFVSQVKEVEYGRVGYVNTALLGLTVKATDQLSGAMPTITVMVKGRVLRDVRTGEIGWAYSRNPANIIYDLLTNKRYGLGNAFGFSQAHIDSMSGTVLEFIDMDSLRQFANYCDELVTYSYYDPTNANANERGWVTANKEKRYELNCVLDTPSRAMDLITKLCGTCRALSYWQGSQFKVVIERESNPVQLFSMGNIVKDSYSEDYVSIRDIPNIMECYILDEANDYARTAITGMDRVRWNEPTRVKEVNLYGLTRLSRAKREIAFAMNKAKTIRKFITFQAGLDSIVCEAGDVFMFQHQIPQYGLAGGNIKKISQGTFDRWEVEIDRTVDLVAGREYCLRVRRNINNTQKVYWFDAVASGKTRVLTLPAYESLGFSVGDLYAVGEGLNIAFGNIESIDIELNYVTIDAQVTMIAGRQYSLRVQTPDGALRVHTFMADANYTGRLLRLNPGEILNFSVGDIYAFGFISKEAVAFRLTSMVRKDDKKAEITAEQYINSVFTDDHTISVRKPRRKALGVTAQLTADTGGGEIEEPVVTLDSELDEYTGSRHQPPPLVTDVVLSEEVVLVGDVYQPQIVVSFGEVDLPDNAIARIDSYEIMVSIDGGETWAKDGSCTHAPYRIRGVKADVTYHVLVKPRTNYGITNEHEDSEGALSFSITPTGDLPADTIVTPPSGLICNSTPFANELRWTESECPTLKAHEVWCAVNQNDRSAAVKVAVVRGMSCSHGNLDPDDEYFYWIRAVNKKNKASAYHPGDTAGVRGKLLDFDGGTF